MSKYNICYIMGKSCRNATVLGDCIATKKDCDREVPFILNDIFDDDIDKYLGFDLFDEEDI